MNPLDTKMPLSTGVTSKISNISSETNRVNELVKKVTDTFAEKKLFNEVDNVITQLKEMKGKPDSLKIGDSHYRMLFKTKTQTISIIPPEENMSPDDTAKYLADIIEVLENYKEKQPKSSDVLETKYKNALSELFTEKGITTESQQEQLRKKIEEQTHIIIKFGTINGKKCITSVTGEYQGTQDNLFKYTSTYNKEELAYIEKNKKDSLNVNYVNFEKTDSNASRIKENENTINDIKRKIQDMEDLLKKILDEVRTTRELGNQQAIDKAKRLLADESLQNAVKQMNAQKDQLSALLEDNPEQLVNTAKEMLKEIDALQQSWLQALQDIKKMQADGGVVSGVRDNLQAVNDLVQQGREKVKAARELGNQQAIDKAKRLLADESLQNAVKQMNAQKDQLSALLEDNPEQLVNTAKEMLKEIDALQQSWLQALQDIKKIQTNEEVVSGVRDNLQAVNDLVQQGREKVKAARESGNQQDINKAMQFLTDASNQNAVKKMDAQKDQLSALLTEDSPEQLFKTVQRMHGEIDAAQQAWSQALQDIKKIQADGGVVSGARDNLQAVNDLVRQGQENVKTARDSGNQQDINKAMQFLTDASNQNAVKKMDAQKDQLSALLTEDSPEQLFKTVQRMHGEIDAAQQAWSQALQDIKKIQADGGVVSGARDNLQAVNDLVRQGQENVKTARDSGNQQDIDKAMQFLTDASNQNTVTQMNAQKDQLSALITEGSPNQLASTVQDMLDEIDAAQQAWSQALQDIKKIQADGGVVSGARDNLQAVNDLVRQGQENVKTARDSGNQQDIDKAMQFLTDASNQNAVTQMNAQKDQLSALLTEDSPQQLANTVQDMLGKIDAAQQAWSQALQDIKKIQADGGVVSGARDNLQAVNDLVRQGQENVKTARDSGNQQDIDKAMQFLTDASNQNAVTQMNAQKDQLSALVTEDSPQQLANTVQDMLGKIDAAQQAWSQALQDIKKIQADGGVVSGARDNLQAVNDLVRQGQENVKTARDSGNQQDIDKAMQFLTDASNQNAVTQMNAQKDQLSALVTEDSPQQLANTVQDMLGKIDAAQQAWSQALQDIKKIQADGGVVSGARDNLQAVNDLVRQGQENVKTARDSGNQQDIDKAMQFLTDASNQNAVTQMNAQKDQLSALVTENSPQQLANTVQDMLGKIDAAQQAWSQALQDIKKIQADERVVSGARDNLQTVNDLVRQGQENVKTARESGNQKDIDKAMQFLTDAPNQNAIKQMNAQKDQLSALLIEGSPQQLTNTVQDMHGEIDAAQQAWSQALQDIEKIQADGGVVSGVRNNLQAVNDLVRRGQENVKTARESGNQQDIDKAMQFLTDAPNQNAIKQMNAQKDQLLALITEDSPQQLTNTVQDMHGEIDAAQQAWSQALQDIEKIQADGGVVSGVKDNLQAVNDLVRQGQKNVKTARDSGNQKDIDKAIQFLTDAPNQNAIKQMNAQKDQLLALITEDSPQQLTNTVQDMHGEIDAAQQAWSQALQDIEKIQADGGVVSGARDNLQAVNDLVRQGQENVKTARESGNQQDIDKAMQFLTNKSHQNTVIQMNAQKDQLSALVTEDSPQQLANTVQDMLGKIDAAQQAWSQALQDIKKIQADGGVVSAVRDNLQAVNDLVRQGQENVKTARESGNQQDIDKAMQFLTNKSHQNTVIQMNAQKDQLSALITEDSPQQLANTVQDMLGKIDAAQQAWSQALQDIKKIQADGGVVSGVRDNLQAVNDLVRQGQENVKTARESGNQQDIDKAMQFLTNKSHQNTVIQMNAQKDQLSALITEGSPEQLVNTVQRMHGEIDAAQQAWSQALQDITQIQANERVVSGARQYIKDAKNTLQQGLNIFQNAKESKNLKDMDTAQNFFEKLSNQNAVAQMNAQKNPLSELLMQDSPKQLVNTVQAMLKEIDTTQQTWSQALQDIYQIQSDKIISDTKREMQSAENILQQGLSMLQNAKESKNLKDMNTAQNFFENLSNQKSIDKLDELKEKLSIIKQASKSKELQTTLSRMNGEIENLQRSWLHASEELDQIRTETIISYIKKKMKSSMNSVKKAYQLHDRAKRTRNKSDMDNAKNILAKNSMSEVNALVKELSIIQKRTDSKETEIENLLKEIDQASEKWKDASEDTDKMLMRLFKRM